MLELGRDAHKATRTWGWTSTQRQCPDVLAVSQALLCVLGPPVCPSPPCMFQASPLRVPGPPCMSQPPCVSLADSGPPGAVPGLLSATPPHSQACLRHPLAFLPTVSGSRSTQGGGLWGREATKAGLSAQGPPENPPGARGPGGNGSLVLSGSRSVLHGGDLTGPPGGGGGGQGGVGWELL